MCVVSLQSLVPARFETRTVTGLVKGHAYSVTAVEEVKLHTQNTERGVLFLQRERGLNVRSSTTFKSVLSYSANRRSTRTPKFVWCVSGTRGVKWSGTVPGVTSGDIFFPFLTT